MRTVKDKLQAAEHALTQEQAKFASTSKRLEQQAARVAELDDRVIELQKSTVSMEVNKEVTDQQLERYKQKSEELEKKFKRLEEDYERMRMRPGNKIFRPVGAGSMLDAFREKVDFEKIKLRPTSSKFLEGKKNR
jgi:chromosome segregation ATPase